MPLTEVLVSSTRLQLNMTTVYECQYVGESPQDCLTAIANRETAWISNFAVPKPPKDIFVASKAQNSPSSHISLYKCSYILYHTSSLKTRRFPALPFGIDIFIPQTSLRKAIELLASLTGRIYGLALYSSNSGIRNLWIIMVRCC